MNARGVLLILVFSPLTLSFFHGRLSSRLEDESEDDPATTPSPLPEHWFHQKLDHFNLPDNRYWQQRYYINDTFYKPGGPVFLYISGEGQLDQIYMRTGAWMEYAQTYNAICYGLEHRYYGHSRPTPNLSTANLQFLTVEQALADLATFITFLKKQPKLADAKLVVFGGSYSGMLSAWMRYKFPHLVDGAVAHSATIALPLENTGYVGVMGDALRTVPGCFDAVKTAFDDVRGKLKTDAGTKRLQELFRMCDFDRNNKLDVENVMNQLVSYFFQVIQYSDDHWVGYRMMSVSHMCGTLVNKTKGEPLERLADYATYLSYSYRRLNGSCMPVAFSADGYGKSLEYRGLARPWTYQVCTQLGDFEVSYEGSEPFGKTTSLDYHIKRCEETFGPQINITITTAGNRGLLMDYGGRAQKATNIVYTQGSYDPFHITGFNKDDIPGSHVFLIKGVGHVAAQFSSSPLDNAQLKHARVMIQRYIGQWISSKHPIIIG